MGKHHVDLRLVRSHIPQKDRQGPVGVRSCDKVHFARLEELVLEPFGHAPDNPDHNLRPVFLLLVELFEASPYSLFRIVPD